MGAYERRIRSGVQRINLGSLTLTGAGNETVRYGNVNYLNFTNLGSKGVGDYINAYELIQPIGVEYTVTTGITVTNAVVQLNKNGAVVGTNQGFAVMPIQAISTTPFYSGFVNDYTDTNPLPTDLWSLKVSTTATAGVVNPVNLLYVSRSASGINEGIPPGGLGYTSAPTVAIQALNGVGSGATATAVVSGGSVTAINVTAGGSAYTIPPFVLITGGAGWGAQANATIVGGIVTAITLKGF